MLGGQTRNRVARINPGGSLDSSFDPGANSTVISLAVQVNGGILVGGNFTMLDGLERNYIGLLSSNTAALQNLNTNSCGTTVTWMRSGSSPEVWRVTFESSIDGIIYTPLGEGVRITGGWELTGLELQIGQNLFLRARGYYMTGAYNGSSSVIESVRNVYLPAPVYESFLPMITRQ
jgi:hypothetical protein